jgi:hypothetical protein
MPLKSIILYGYTLTGELIWKTPRLTGTIAWVNEQYERALNRGFTDMSERIARVALEMSEYNGNPLSCTAGLENSEYPGV